MAFFEGSKDVTIRGGTFIAQRGDPSQRAFESLAAKALPSAFHLADADTLHSTCLPNTRVKVLDRIKSWADRRTMSNAFILWLHGAAGGGKTAIARTIAQWCQTEGILLGEFFFSRADGTRGHLGSLAATLAYRMATHTLPAAKKIITQAVADDPHIFSASLADQITRLVLNPLNLEAPNGIVPHVIVLDGLDECLSDADQDLVLNVLSGTMNTLNPELRILICSRPEPTIATAFNAPQLRAISARISLNDDTDSDSDIQLFLVEQFSKLKQQLPHPPKGDWPTADALAHIVTKSSGQFIFAATVVKYVCAPRHRHNAVTRLDHVLNLKQLPANTKQHPFAELDALYSLILSTRELEGPETTAKATAICLEYPTYFEGISPEELAKVLEFELTRTRAILDELASLFEVTGKGQIKPFHASFGDFLYDKGRSGHLHCNQEDIKAEIACALLRQGHDNRELSFKHLVRLMHDIPANKSLQAVLTKMDPSWLLKGKTLQQLDVQGDAFYLVPLLCRFQRHIALSSDGNNELSSYLDAKFAEHVDDLLDWPELQSVSDSSDDGDFAYDDSDEGSDFGSDDNPGIPSSRPNRLSIQDMGVGSMSNQHSSSGAGQRLNSKSGADSGETESNTLAPLSFDKEPPTKLVLLSALPAWDDLVISRGLNLSGSSWRGEGSLRSICYEASFVRSQLQQTWKVLIRGPSQADAASFCLSKLGKNTTPEAHYKVFAALLPHCLSYASASSSLKESLINFVRTKSTAHSRLPIATKDAITAYISLNDSNPTNARQSPAKTSYQPSFASSPKPFGAPGTQAIPIAHLPKGPNTSHQDHENPPGDERPKASDRSAETGNASTASQAKKTKKKRRKNRKK